jgi:hypothetical protein
MKKRMVMAGLMGAMLLAPLPVLAHANIGIGINLGGPGYVEAPPPVVYQQPYYAEPPPVVVGAPYGYGYGPGPYYNDPYWRYHHRYWRHYRRY